MTLSFQIRLAACSDAAEIARLSSELGYPASAQEFEARLVALLLRPEHFIAVAAGASSLLGWVAANHRMQLESGQRAELVGLVVDATARRTGVGQALVAAAEQWALAQGLKTILVRSNITRVESHPFYQGIGYVREKTQHSYIKTLSAV